MMEPGKNITRSCGIMHVLRFSNSGHRAGNPRFLKTISTGSGTLSISSIQVSPAGGTREPGRKATSMETGLAEEVSRIPLLLNFGTVLDRYWLSLTKDAYSRFVLYGDEWQIMRPTNNITFHAVIIEEAKR